MQKINPTILPDEELILQGKKLIDSLENEGNKYHPKSSMYDSFMWEAIGIKTRVDALIKKEFTTRVSKNCGDTFGEGLRELSPQLADVVSEFYKRYYT